MNDNSTADDALLTYELDLVVLNRASGVALAISLEVAEITDVAVGIGWCTVAFGEWVDCSEKTMLAAGCFVFWRIAHGTRPKLPLRRS